VDIFDGCCSPSRLQQEFGDIFDAAAFLQNAQVQLLWAVDVNEVAD
jgi:hypothetical protein